jgi:hypothetical protein
MTALFVKYLNHRVTVGTEISMEITVVRRGHVQTGILKMACVQIPRSSPTQTDPLTRRGCGARCCTRAPRTTSSGSWTASSGAAGHRPQRDEHGSHQGASPLKTIKQAAFASLPARRLYPPCRRRPQSSLLLRVKLPCC